MDLVELIEQIHAQDQGRDILQTPELEDMGLDKDGRHIAQLEASEPQEGQLEQVPGQPFSGQGCQFDLLDRCIAGLGPDHPPQGGITHGDFCA